jgi:hypothetical protein
MFKNGIVGLVVLEIALAGCQQPGKGLTAPANDVPATPVERATHVGADGFEAKHKQLVRKFVDRVMPWCQRTTGDMEFKACIHQHTLRAFDPNGVVGRNCPLRDDMDDDLNCILVGGEGYQLASKLGADAVTTFDWKDPVKSSEDVTRQLFLKESTKCAASGTSSDTFECSLHGLGETLELTNEDLGPCYAYGKNRVQLYRCIDEAYSYKYMSAALDRI